ncbi:MAG: glycosyltransferase family 1 protein [Clostridia bacterium]|nr:glycosyltransferase family 1 protein [Clostridia bacterium]
MDNPLRVLHILQRMEPAGVQSLLMNLYREIDRTKVQFDFLVHYTAPQFYDEEIAKLGGRIYRLSVREDYNFIKYYRDLKKFFGDHKEYKIVHGHMHSLGAIYLHVAKKFGIPVRIAHSHTNATQNDIKKCIKILMNRLYAKSANKLMACSVKAGKYMFGNADFQVVNNAVCSDRFVFSKNNREKIRNDLGVRNKMIIGTAGRFTVQKNQKFAIEIFEKYHEKHSESILLLIGDGELRKELEEMVVEKNIEESVMFLGHRGDMAELYQAMDVFLMPSLFEGLGIVAVEAQAAGTPTVCTDTLPEEIDITPLLKRVPLDSPVNDWVEAIEKAAENPYAHGNMKKYLVEADYDIKLLAQKMQDYYMAEHGMKR